MKTVMPDSAEDNVACRICMDSKDNYVSLFSHDLSKKVMEIADVEVEKNDGLPDTICTECETDLEKCYEFRVKVQVADQKFRNSLKFSQVDISECNIKKERYMDDGKCDEVDDRDSASMDDDYCNDEPEAVKSNKDETEEAEPYPLNHVVVVDEKERKIEMSEDPLGQDEAMVEEPQVRKVEEPAVDPLICMKQEAEAEIMDVDSSLADPFGPSSSVSCTELPKSFPYLSPGVFNHTNQFEIKINQQPVILLKIKKASLHSPKEVNKKQETSSPLQSTSTQPPAPTSAQVDPVVENECFCPVCNLDFGFPDLLDEHKNGKSFICRVCTLVFKSHLELETHFFSHQKFTCEVCKKVFYGKSDLLHHRKNVLACKKIRAKLKCKICHNTFIHEMNFQTHMEQKHPDANSRPFNCQICNSKFKISGALRDHMKLTHMVYESIECDICHKILLGPESVKRHVKTKHLQSLECCPICKKVYSSKAALKTHLQGHLGEEIVCDICGAVLKGKAAFKFHLYKHKRKTYSCTQCSITFHSLSERGKHYREKHKNNTPKPVICEFCGKEYKTMTILKHHLVTHSDVKPFECDVCGASFKTKTVLKTHTRIHNNLKKYSCLRCGEGFRWKQTFDKHVLKCESSQDGDKSGGTESD